MFNKKTIKKAEPLPKHRDDPDEPTHLLADRAQLKRVREARWAKLLKSFRPPKELLAWAERMTLLHGNDMVQIYQNEVPWITALYIIRYGENEAYWPATLSQEDLDRAIALERGSRPALGMKILPRKDDL